MKKILLLGMGGLLILASLIANILQAVQIAHKINASNFFRWFVGFILDFITTPVGLIGIVLLIIGLMSKKK